MSMRAVRALDLARKVRDRHELLGAGGKVAQTDLSCGQLIADDDREVGLVTGGSLELLAKLSAAKLGTRSDPRRAEVGGDLQPCRGVIRVRSDDDSDEGGFRR